MRTPAPAVADIWVTYQEPSAASGIVFALFLVGAVALMAWVWSR